MGHVCKCVGQTFSCEQWEQLDRVIEQYKSKKGALIPVLHKAQGIFGYLPKEVQVKIAEGLDVPLSEVYGVVTFYSFFNTEAAGKHTIRVCMGTACYVRGAQELVDNLSKELDVEVGGTSTDGLFTLEVNRCIGACGLAPVMTVDDHDVFAKVRPAGIPEILGQYKEG
ncbi:MAG: NAD(P)H-dependent oxidoreductase subunit E [Bacteroidota bacterium]